MNKTKESLSIFQKIELVITHPHKFFENIKEDKNIWDAFEFYFVFAFLSIIINALFFLPDLIKTKSYLTIFFFILFIIIFIIFILLISLGISFLSFAVYWVYHIIIKLFKGKKKYNDTYKLLYASTPMLIALLVPFNGVFKIIFYPLFVLAVLDTAYINFIGLQKLQKMNKLNSVLVIGLSLFLDVLIFLILRGIYG